MKECQNPILAFFLEHPVETKILTFSNCPLNREFQNSIRYKSSMNRKLGVKTK